ncbi:protein FAM83B [Synchiropus splendidus]|uniref:protein FAM83B n=1 Tax=Synchiropus splendidus TaxID=270530 RepID=UPI00237DF00C|nr:protein FAM83B [Synchiropus splendidus]XP_053730962.1 protein FAM83B [Synchiropus splendidus]XP_053730963.1 protein FAM83B [Synchiropus splendidus]XP_053730964.1 protein FAM83B [Synchiropus splendidus]XP_053730965.1 protein FAM83B [Synchiropus splendidus]XP_053730966.1 protein FAM83B [Synchiropus splendidus]XP_053730967.1 protein FAM83B [Synchiropus splendidus]XP_053730968.1 protein FAM83B [Synchiropus splendidus]XP_053730970.1 protein FAM83B [Synchiropus splendidus]XP_053730971.1 prote
MMPGVMETPEFSSLSSLRGDFKSEDFIQPHYKETYRLAIDRLVSSGREKYQEFLKGERLGSFLSEEELVFISKNAKKPPPQTQSDSINGSLDTQSSSGTYWPTHSDVDAPDLELGWPDVMHDKLQTNIDLLFHPPRLNSPTIKEVIRKKIQEARQVVAVVMDTFTDVDIFKEAVDASIRGVAVYVLLDHFHLRDFLTMAENYDVKIQQLRNMRVRTVKGQDYLCQSGAKFHGAMKQKFLLVDCQTAVYGSYSFAWSFEKINLSMVQVISGFLVKSYDEEFRTLYAQSTVPVEIYPADMPVQMNGSHGRQFLPNTISDSTQGIDRRDQLRRTLDTVYRTVDRKQAMRNFQDRLVEEKPIEPWPVFDNDIEVQSHSLLHSPEPKPFQKRHSYAGGGRDDYTPRNIRSPTGNWNVGIRTNNLPPDNSPAPNLYRGQNMRRSYNGLDKQVLSVQQNMPTLEKTSKSFMRAWRIEAYLQNSDASFWESNDYLDQYEQMDKPNTFMQGRMRSSLAFRSTIPEQIEPNSYDNTSTDATPPNHYSSIEWHPPVSPQKGMDEFMMKRQSLQILDDPRTYPSFTPGRTDYHSTYNSLGRSKPPMLANPDMLSDNWHKRHSVADPKTNYDKTRESPGQMYGSSTRMQINRYAAGIKMQNGGFGMNLNEDQRSVSHYDVKNIKDCSGNNYSNWQEPPSRTVSAAALDDNLDLTMKSNNTGSRDFLKKSSKKIKSLLNIPGKKDEPMKTSETQSIASQGSTDTLRAQHAGNLNRGSTYRNSGRKSPPDRTRNPIKDEHRIYSQPRFGTEEYRPLANVSSDNRHMEPSARPSYGSPIIKNDRQSGNRPLSRFEPFCSLEQKQPVQHRQSYGNTPSAEKTKAYYKDEADIEHSITRVSRNHHDNKFEKFFHRMGNLIHKKH